jgi:hypothetical protein
VTIQLPEVSEIKALKEVAVLQKTLLYGIACLLAETQYGWDVRKYSPQATLKVVVQRR